jgi:hypothetical protein
MGKISSYANGAPALSADELLIARAGGTSHKLTVDQILAHQTRRNLVINGDFRIAQRGTSLALSTAFQYGLDRWLFAQSGAANAVAQSANSSGSGFGFPRALRLGRNPGAATTGFISANTVFETTDSVRFQGAPVVLSWWALAGANFSAAGGAMSVDLSIGTGTDQPAANYPIGLWSGQTQMIGAAQAVTGIWARYSRAAVLNTNTNQIGIQLGYNPTGVAGADDAIYITGVQLEPGVTPSPFEFRPYASELALCQRYFEKSYDIATPPGSVTNNGMYEYVSQNAQNEQRRVGNFAVTKRAVPTVTIYSPNDGAAGNAYNVNLAINVAHGVEGQGESGFSTNAAVGGVHIIRLHWAASAEL